MKPNVGKVEVHEEYYKLFTDTYIGKGDGARNCYIRMYIVLVYEGGGSSTVGPTALGAEDGVPYGVFNVKPGKNVTEIIVGVGCQYSPSVVPLLKLLPPEGEKYVMEADKLYTFRLWVKFGEAKVEEA